MKKNLLLVIILTAIMISMVAILGCYQPPTYQISGEIVKVEYIAEGSSFNAQDILVTVVRFKDGRVKTFNGISKLMFMEGVVNTIVYDSRHRIVKVVIVGGQ